METIDNTQNKEFYRLFQKVSDCNGIPLIQDLQEIISIVHEDFPKPVDEVIDTPFTFTSDKGFTTTNT